MNDKDFFNKLLNPKIIGKIKGAYGVLGWMKIISFTDCVDNIFDYGPWYTFHQSQWKILCIDQWKRLLTENYIVKIIGISNKESANLLSNLNLIVDKSQFPVLCKDEYYWNDLIGCSVFNIKSVLLGTVVSIIETIVNDVLVINLLHSKNRTFKLKDCLIPFIQNKVIKHVNLNDHIIVVDWDCDF